ncbi:hypothetical protein [Chelativorans salis]|uniref:Uncharacterized protein n=1 Tax=Chelativorans salis TaxID=2978478 RepID=A0ABT2LKA1_9HYPH|nr:hypothetical protein [Chelativorans sp. EGI FJ00035]MCT7374852.1 hypothetical protein [Chelativorans sp. EGI FJ00035]
MDDDEQFMQEMMQSIGEAMKTIPASMRVETGPDEPPPFPREQMTVMYRFLANDAGLPKRCPRRICGRTGCCHGGLGPGDSDACGKLWDDAGSHCMMTAFLALELGWVYERQRKRALVNWMRGLPMADGEEPEEADLPWRR